METAQYIPQISRASLVRMCEDMGMRLDSNEIDRLHGYLLMARAELYGTNRLDSQELSTLERFDANETLVLGPTGQLEYLRARENETKRPAFKGELLVPVTHEIPRGAQTASYSTWDQAGMADLIANPADDVKKVGVKASKFTFPIEPFGSGYEYSMEELEATAFAGTPLRSKLARALAHAFMQRKEIISARGHAGTALTGLLNHANVPVINAAAAAGGANAPQWNGADKTNQEILTDLLTMEDTVVTQTAGVENPDTLVLPLSHFRLIQNRQLEVGTGANASDTIARVFLQRATSVRNIEWWLHCDNADAAGTGPRACMYRRHPDVVHHEIPVEPTELPPQRKNFVFEILAFMKSAGVWWEYPLAGVYMDSI